MSELRCKGLFKSFDGLQALAGVDFELPASGIIAIIGPNGAGKTTLLNIITGFLRPDRGECFIGGHKLTYLPPHKITSLGVCRTFQEVRIFPGLSVIDNVLISLPGQRHEGVAVALLGIGVAGEERRARKEAESILDSVGLVGEAESLASELSYGQQKLLSIACCLGTGGTIVFLDEPVAGVHPQMIEQLIGLIHLLKQQGKLVVFIEHDIAVVRRLADFLLVMDHGKILLQGKPGTVLEDPRVMEAYVG